MNKVKVLTVTFDTHIQPWEMPLLRGAIAEKVNGHDLFHNHKPDKGFYYRYPLIQYKFHKKKPILFALNDGIEALQSYFQEADWSLQLKTRHLPMLIETIDLQECEVKLQEQQITYHLRNWLPFNAKNYTEYKALTTDEERHQLLERILCNHLVAWTFSSKIKLNAPIKVIIKEIKSKNWTQYKKVWMLSFSLTFQSNLTLPNYCGIGKGASTGWGVLKYLQKSSE